MVEPQPLVTRSLSITLAVCVGPRQIVEHALQLPRGASIADALDAIGQHADQCVSQGLTFGVWGRSRPAEHQLREGDRVEVYRALQVDPKVARRERFARQGARGAGLFATRRPGAKAGY